MAFRELGGGVVRLYAPLREGEFHAWNTATPRVLAVNTSRASSRKDASLWAQGCVLSGIRMRPYGHKDASISPITLTLSRVPSP